tara:strand:- start:804 stop:1079 length:276 start_codon:yes stop_codon:yes gene_type:complete
MNVSLEMQIINRAQERMTEYSEIVWELKNLDTITEDDLISSQMKLANNISKLFAWSPSLIATVFYYAMEDSNAHSFNKDLLKLIEKHSLSQ